MRQVVNIVYAHLAEGMDAAQLDELDRDLSTDPAMLARFGARSKGADHLMALMGGTRKPSSGGGH